MSTQPNAIGQRKFVTLPSAGWIIRASCRRHDPELFFPSIGSDTAKIRQAAAAAKICGDCTVRPYCARQAIAACERFGVWAGVNLETHTARERREKVTQLELIAAEAA